MALLSSSYSDGSAKVPMSLKCPSSSSSTSSPENAAIVYVNAGQSFQYQQYIWQSIEQARRFNAAATTPIAVISSKAAIQELRDKNPEIIRDIVEALQVTLVEYDNYLNDVDIVRQFQQVFFIQGDMLPIDGNTDFVRATSMRLFLLYSWMQETGQQNVIHLENDNLIYFNAQEMAGWLERCRYLLGFPMVSDRYAILGVMFVQNAEALLNALQFTVDIYRMGAKAATDYIGFWMLNDMTVFQKYLFESRHAQQQLQLQQNSTIRDGYCAAASELPDKLTPGPQEDSCLWEVSGQKVLFDPATLGQWFGGTHVNPNSNFFETSDTRYVDPRQLKWSWQDSESGFQVPLINSEYHVANLHVHSKDLKKWWSPVNTKNTT